MKKMLVVVSILFIVGLAQAAPLPSLTTVPPGLTLSQTNYAEYSDITLSGASYYPYGAAVAAPPSPIGDDYLMTTNLRWQESTNDTELGLLVRGDLVNLKCYEVSMNPTNNYLALVRIDSGTSFVNLDLDGPISGFDRMEWHTLRFLAVGSDLEAWLYDSDENLIGHVSATDSTYSTGQIGVFELKHGTSSIHGGFEHTRIVPEPATMGLLALGLLGLLRRRS